jgi:hypothetical protein
MTGAFQCMCTYGICKWVGKTAGKYFAQAIRSTMLPNLDAVNKVTPRTTRGFVRKTMTSQECVVCN